MNNSYVTFDRLRLSLPTETVSILQPELFTSTVTGEGEVLRQKYEQTTPFYYSIITDATKQTTIVEFNGKVLLDDYPSLININNITHCFENINRYRVCYISPTEAIEQAYVLQCDVTRDVASTTTVKDLRQNLTLQNSSKWCIRDATSNRFSIESTVTTTRMKTRMIIYDKGTEMARKPNESFRYSVSNCDYQLEYFSNKIRYELNLQSIDRIRKYFEVDNTKLTTLLNSVEDPILNLLQQAVVNETGLSRAADYAGNLRDLEHLLMLATCNFDLAKLERVIRDLYGSSRSIMRALEPYKVLLSSLTKQIPKPDKDLPLIDLRNHIRYILAKTFCYTTDAYYSNNLLQIYQDSGSVDV